MFEWGGYGVQVGWRLYLQSFNEALERVTEHIYAVERASRPMTLWLSRNSKLRIIQKK